MPGALIDDACVDAPVTRSLVDVNGIIHDQQVRSAISRAVSALTANIR